MLKLRNHSYSMAQIEIGTENKGYAIAKELQDIRNNDEITDSVPKISCCYGKKRHIEKIPAGRYRRFTKSVPFHQTVLPNKYKKDNCLQNTVNHNSYNRKCQLVLFI